MLIRIPTQTDLHAIAEILHDTDLFPAEMLEEMISPFFEKLDGPERWIVLEDGAGDVAGFAYYRAEPLTDGTWNLLAIGVRSGRQGRGYGEKLVDRVESELASERVLVVETSGTEDFQATRQFYDGLGYSKEAVIRDYWSDGDDKVIYWKALR